jgi:hypothetical protein
MKNLGVTMTTFILAASVAGGLYACGKDDGGSSKKHKKTTSVSKMTVSGQLALALNLDGAPRVSHVMAVSPQGGERVVAAIGSDSSFSLAIDKTKTWIIALLDDEKTGADMVVGRFKSDVLDSLMPTSNVQSSIALGQVTPPSTDTTDKAATVSLSFADLASKLGLSAAGAQFAGEIDDICLRYVNPDVDGNGQIDALEAKADGKSRSFMLDFHNRFDPKDANGNNITLAAFKNAMPTPASITHSSTGLMLYVPKAYHPTQPTTFSNRFEEAVKLEGQSTTTEANTWVETPFDSSYPSSDDTWNLHVEMGAVQPPDGKYEVKLDTTTFTFTNIKVSDLSAPVGFLIPMVKINVDDSDNITSVDWKWFKKTATGFADATSEEVNLVVSGTSPYLGLYFTDGTDLGFPIGKDATGTVNARTIGKKWANIVTNRSLGLSYDDKLGMRMFVNIYAQ